MAADDLSTGMPSTLGSYLTICRMVYGEDSAATEYIRARIREGSGPTQQVLADESQMLVLLTQLHSSGK